MTTAQPSTAEPARARELPAMTGIRGAAAIWVVVYHFSPVFYQLLPGMRVAERVVHAGLLSVDIFFVLSGFILSYTYAERLTSLDGARLRRFFRARFARIYPVYVLSMLLTLGLVAAAAVNGRSWDASRDFTATGFVANLLMLQSFPGVTLWNAPSWSVACEVFAYLVFPFVAGLLLRLSVRASAALAATIIVTATLVLVMFPDAPYVTVQSWIRVTAGITAGCLLWRVWQQKVHPHPAWDAVALLCVAGTLAVALSGADPYLALPLVMLFVLAVAGSTGVVRRVLASRPLHWTGRLSYSIYLLQIPVFHVLLAVHSPRWFVASSLPVRIGLVVAYLGTLLLGAAITHHLIEEPARRWLLRRRTVAPEVSEQEPARAK